MKSYAYKLSSQVVREVSGQSTGPEESASPVIPKKNKLDKVSVEDRLFVVTQKFLSSRHNSSSQLR